jgi:hypothetical protein
MLARVMSPEEITTALQLYTRRTDETMTDRESLTIDWLLASVMVFKRTICTGGRYWD